MKLNRLFPALLVMVAVSCSDLSELDSDNAAAGKGEVRFDLSADLHDGIVITRAEEMETVPVDSFWVEIYKQGVLRLYREKYEVAGQDFILLNEGDYLLRAKYGDSLGVGFDKPFYMAEQQFTVRPQTKETVSAVARLANVKVKVEFSENFSEYYPDYHVLVRHTSPDVRSALKIGKDEKRAGYIPAGQLILEVYADRKGDGVWKYYALEPAEYAPNDFVTFHVDAAPLEGGLKVGIKIDDDVEVVDKEVFIPERMTSQRGPVVTAQGPDVEGHCFVHEGTEDLMDKLSFSCQAKAGIKSMTLKHDDAWLLGQGVPEVVELTATDAALKTTLGKLGVRWTDNGIMGVVDLTDILPAIGRNAVYTGRDAILSTFTFSVTDFAGKVAESKASLKVYPGVEGTFIVRDTDAWATKVTGLKADFTKGNTDLLTLQYSTDKGSSWHDVVPASRTSNSLTYNTLTGLEPDTEHVFRYLYDGFYEVLDRQTVRTETAAQPGNPGFEEYTVKEYGYTIFITGSKGKVLWYELFKDPSTAWWATNSSATLDGNFSVANIGFKTQPTVLLQYGQAAEGQINAMVASVAVDDWGSKIKFGNAVTGEIFIGKADNSGEHKGGHLKDGHSFPSRPTSFTMKYKFSPHENDPFYVKIEMKAADGTVIGSGISNTVKTATDRWTELKVPVNYTVTDKKAADIFVSIKSSATGSLNSREYTGFMQLGAGPSSVNGNTVHLGNILWVDDIILTYE